VVSICRLFRSLVVYSYHRQGVLNVINSLIPSSALSGPPIIIFASVPQQPQNRNLCAVQIHADLDNFAI